VRQDLDRNRATEVDFINGEIVRLAEGCGRTAPLNALVVQLVHELETRGGAMSREDVIRRFASAI
jgi:2-dehydropantoate 2-reductase